MRLLGHRPVASASAVLFFSGFSLYGAMLLLPLYYQEVRGASALAAGIMLVPQGVGALFSRPLAGRLTDTIGARWIAVAGFVIVAVSTAPLRLRRAGHQSVAARGVPGRPRLRARRGHHPGHGGGLHRPGQGRRSPTPSVLTRTVQQIGGSFGTAVLAVTLSSAVAAHRGHLAAGFDVAFWWSVGFAGLAALLSLWLPGRPRAVRAQAAAAPGATQGAVGTGQPVR